MWVLPSVNFAAYRKKQVYRGAKRHNLFSEDFLLIGERAEQDTLTLHVTMPMPRALFVHILTCSSVATEYINFQV